MRRGLSQLWEQCQRVRHHYVRGVFVTERQPCVPVRACWLQDDLRRVLHQHSVQLQHSWMRCVAAATAAAAAAAAVAAVSTAAARAAAAGGSALHRRYLAPLCHASGGARSLHTR